MSKKEVKTYFHDKRVLVTGGLGFIGSNLAIRLVGLGAKVTIIDAMIPGHGGNAFNIKGIKGKVRVNLSDIRKEKTIGRLAGDAELIFNLAGQISHIDSMENPCADLELNTEAHLSLLGSCKKHNPGVKIIFASTRQVYGRPTYLPVDENHPVNPVDINGINKLAAEQYHILYNRVYGIKTVCLRITNTYGPRMLIKHNRQGFVGWFLRRTIEGKELEVFGDGSQLRDLNYIDDVVDALLISGCEDSLSGRIFNLGNSPPISLEEIAKLLIKINGSGHYRLRPFPEQKKKIDIGDYYASYARFKDATGWQPRVSYEEGFIRAIDYYKKNRWHYI